MPELQDRAKTRTEPRGKAVSDTDKIIRDAMEVAMDWILLIGPNTPPDKQPALIEKLKECAAIYESTGEVRTDGK